ncbi:MAG: AEC family transporter [Pseudomonadota bacterium]
MPVFLIVGAGFGATRAGLFRAEFSDGLMRFTQTFAIPCLLFLSIWQLDLGAVFHREILLSFYTGSALCFALSALGARVIFGRRPGEAVAVGFCALFANSVLLGMPLVERAFGAEALAPLVAIVAIHAPFCYLLGITTMEFARADGRPLGATLGTVANAMFRNGLMIGIGLGFAANLTGIALPDPGVAALEMMAQAALPAALFGLGGILTRYGLADHIGETAMISALRLVIHPLIALTLATQVFDLSADVTRTITLAAAMPPGVNTFVFATMYGRAQDTAASTVLISTAIAVFATAIWLAVLQALPL